MKMRRVLIGVCLLVGAPLMVTIVGGYIVERIKGTPPDEIAEALRRPFSAIFNGASAWISAPAHVSHGGLLLILSMTAALAGLIASGTWKRLRTKAGSAVVPTGFNPTGVQLAAMGELLRRYDYPSTSLTQLNQHLETLTETAGGRPFLARQMEELARANVVQIMAAGTTDRLYVLTTQGRDWLLDQIEDAREHPEGKPHQESKVAEGFEPTGEQARALVAMIHSYPVTVSIEQLHNAMKLTEDGRPTVLNRAGVYRAMDGLIAAGVVEVVPSGNFNLTPHGRNLALDYVDCNTSSGTPDTPRSATWAAALPVERLVPMPTREVPARLQFAPETFELTPPRCRALLVLRDRVDARTTLHDLYERVVDDGTHIDRQTTKAHLQHDMEAAELAGIVNIERPPSGYGDYYKLTTPQGRDWVLSKQGELQAEAGKGMTPKERGPRYR